MSIINSAGVLPLGFGRIPPIMPIIGGPPASRLFNFPAKANFPMNVLVSFLPFLFSFAFVFVSFLYGFVSIPGAALGFSPKLIIEADLDPIVGAELLPSAFGSAPVLKKDMALERGAPSGFAGASLVVFASPNLETSTVDLDPLNGNLAASLPGSLASGLTVPVAVGFAGNDPVGVGEGEGEEEGEGEDVDRREEEGDGLSVVGGEVGGVADFVIGRGLELPSRG